MAGALRTYHWPRQSRAVATFLAARSGAGTGAVESVARKILNDVRADGDRAICRYTLQFDGARLTPARLELSPAEITAGAVEAPAEVVRSLRAAARNIRAYHKHDGLRSWEVRVARGVRMGKRVLPLDRVGVYVPGGKAVYPSTVLMNVLPAKVAGVGEIFLFTPPDADGHISPLVLAAARIAGVDRVFRIGGVQAIGACAYGTTQAPGVDKIVGPGNKYVAAAKRLVYGQVDIDMIAGPSEVLVLADGSANAASIAAELLAQAEHDEDARSVLVTSSTRLAERVAQETARQIAHAPRAEIIRKALSAGGAIIVTPSIRSACDFANQYAPEHLQILTARPRQTLRLIRHAGSIFLGEFSPVALGDYFAGPNHVLPTGGCARFASPLGVKDFLKESSILEYTRGALAAAGAHVVRLAEAEHLPAHAATIRIRSTS